MSDIDSGDRKTMFQIGDWRWLGALIFATWLLKYVLTGVSDHPVCAASVASRYFVTGASTSPHEEGSFRANNVSLHSIIISCEF
jgi:hypothetical protein